MISRNYNRSGEKSPIPVKLRMQAPAPKEAARATAGSFRRRVAVSQINDINIRAKCRANHKIFAVRSKGPTMTEPVKRQKPHPSPTAAHGTSRQRVAIEVRGDGFPRLGNFLALFLPIAHRADRRACPFQVAPCLSCHPARQCHAARSQSALQDQLALMMQHGFHGFPPHENKGLGREKSAARRLARK